MTYEELRAKVDELRAFTLREIELSEDEKRRRWREVRLICIIGMATMGYMIVWQTLARFMWDKPIYYSHKIFMPTLMFTVFIILLIEAKNRYSGRLCDRLEVVFDSIVIWRGANQVSIEYKRISEVTILSDCLVVRAGKLRERLSLKHFASNEAMNEFGNQLLEVSKDFRLKR